jgi:hypothetical protein
MADIEKVIKAIETHISTDDSVGCDDCTYENDGWCMTRVLSDALALLKELQPRVLSYDEMKTMIGKPVYVEEPKRNADPHCRWGLVVEGEEPPEEGGYNYPGGVDFNVEVGLDTYDGDLYMIDIGCGWRAWTAEPTDDQRMNTPWEGR